MSIMMTLDPKMAFPPPFGPPRGRPFPLPGPPPGGFLPGPSPSEWPLGLARGQPGVYADVFRPPWMPMPAWPRSQAGLQGGEWQSGWQHFNPSLHSPAVSPSSPTLPPPHLLPPTPLTTLEHQSLSAAASATHPPPPSPSHPPGVLMRPPLLAPPWGQGVAMVHAPSSLLPAQSDSQVLLDTIPDVEERRVKRPNVALKVPEARTLLLRYHSILTRLHSLHTLLASHPPSEGHGDEARARVQVDQCKAELVVLRERLGPPAVERLIRRLEQARQRRTQSRVSGQTMRLERARRRREAERASEQWLRAAREAELKEKTERSVQRAAGGVLGEVKLKQAEVRGLQRLASGLQELRELRRDSSKRRGDAPLVAADDQFSSSLSCLLSLLEVQARLYQEEEHALRVLMAEEVAERMAAREGQADKEVKEPLLPPNMAGADDPLLPFQQYYLQAQSSAGALVSIRSEWDRYLSPHGSSLPHKPPPPPPPSSTAWTMHCAAD